MIKMCFHVGVENSIDRSPTLVYHFPFLRSDIDNQIGTNTVNTKTNTKIQNGKKPDKATHGVKITMDAVAEKGSAGTLMSLVKALAA